MYNLVKYTIIVVAMAFTVFMALAVGNMTQQAVELIPKPEFASPIIMDGRSMCMKNSEMNLIEAWENKCSWRGEDKTCSLPKKDVSQMFTYKAWYVNNCR